MPDTLLCATDLGLSGRRNAQLALQLAAKMGASIDLLFVGEPPALPAADPLPAEIRPAADALRAQVDARRSAHQASLDAERARIEGAGVPCRAVFREGHPWEEITALAAETSPRLVVVGPHGEADRELRLEGLRARLLGSTADRVVRHVHRPVLVTPAHARAALDGPIVVGVDLSDVAEAAAREAATLASALGADVVLVHALPTSTDEDGAQHADYASLLHGYAAREAKEHLSAIADSLPTAPAEVRVAPIRGTPGETLVAVAEELSASWIAVGTHGRRGLARWVLGSTAERVLRRADRPVLVVPRTDPEAQS